MDIARIFEVVKKGIEVVDAVWDNRDLAMKAFSSVKSIVDNKETVTEQEVEEVEAELDEMLNEFNSPMPPEDQS